MTSTLDARKPAGFGTAFLQQLWLLGMSGRWIYMILGPIAFLMLILLHTGDLPGTTMLMALIAVAASAFWSVTVWYNEGPARRDYHWSLPVSRGTHELARVIAGAAWLLAVCGLLAVVGLAADVMNGTIGSLPPELAEKHYGTRAWAFFFASPLVLYFLVTPLTLWSDYRITRWMIASWVVFVFVALWTQSMGFHQLAHGLEFVFGSDGWSLGDALMPGLAAADAGNALLFWLAFGLTLTTATSMFRPDDLRRMLSSLRHPPSSR